jgi:hypothetical protein
MKKILILLLVAMCLFVLSINAFAESSKKKQTVYVPAVHNDLSVESESRIGLTRLVIRNIDLQKPITLISVDFYDSDGTLIKEYLDSKLSLGPLASITFINDDLQNLYPNGDRPSFIVKWEGDKGVNSPIIASSIGILTLDPNHHNKG